MKTPNLKKPQPSPLPGGFVLEDLLVPAFRYYLGRMTIATGDFANSLSRAWPFLSADCRDTISRELEAAFVSDDEERARQLADSDKVTQGLLPLGWDCDRDMWGLVRKAYSVPFVAVPPQKNTRSKTAQATLPGGFEAQDLLIPAFRYYLGRMTIATSAFAERLAGAWEQIHDYDRQIIARELEHAFKRDAEIRAHMLEVEGKITRYRLPLGMDCDRAAWELVREKGLNTN